MRQTVAIVTALMIALLAVSGFIVAGSVGQMQQLTEKNTLADELSARLKAETTRVSGLEKQNKTLSASLDETVRERDELLTERDQLTVRNNTLAAERDRLLGETTRLDGAAAMLETENQALQSAVDTLAAERDDLTDKLENANAQLAQALSDTRALKQSLARAEEEAAQNALAYEQRTQETAQVIEALAAQAQTLAEVTALKRAEGTEQNETEDAPAPTNALETPKPMAAPGPTPRIYVTPPASEGR